MKRDSCMEIKVCAVIPVLNEEKYIEKCIQSVLSQTVRVDVIVLDGGSTDSTLSILDQFGDSIMVVNNPGKRVAQARNLALELIDDSITHCLELIGHCYIENDHVEKRVNDLIEIEKNLGTKLGAIGCITRPAGETKGVESWIESALSSPIGSGGGQFHNFKGKHETKVPAFCLHNVEALRSVDGWDDRFITSQDSDLSMRLLANGWELWRSDVSSVYMHKRTTLANWWKMSHRYGFWRTKVVLRHPNRFDVREILPLIGIGLVFLLPYWWLAPSAYLLTLITTGFIYKNKKSNFLAILGIPLCLIILHTAFTLGLIDGLIRNGRPSSDRK